jgi:phosphoglycerate kinase
MKKLTIEDLSDDQFRGRKVLVRVDYNVPLDERQQVTDDTRIRATLPTLRRLAGAGARLILASHLGRPKGKTAPEFSLRPAARKLAELSGLPVDFIHDTIGPQARAAARDLREGHVLVLENTRFLPGEEKNDPETSKALAELAEIYVNDAFGSAHRAHSSTAGVAEIVRGHGGLAAAGLLMKRELDYLGSALDVPARPFLAILGGAKISGKIDVIRALLPKTDRILIGGAMANTFFRALDLQTGDSLIEPERIEMAKELIGTAGEKLLLPPDVVIARKLEAGQETRVVDRASIPAGWLALDVGAETRALYQREIEQAGTVLWNGPMGVFEVREFAAGTESIARALVVATERGATTVVGGGDSAAAIAELGLADRVSHVSTGGGASLEFLEGRELPGVAALSNRSEGIG